MKKFAKTIVFIVLCVCIAFTIAACGNKGGNADFSYPEEYETSGITLGRYEELDLLPVEGGAEGITITSANPSIVSVIGNRLIAESEGQTTITATRKKSKKTLTVRVYDDGAKLSLGTDRDIAYIENETDLGLHVVFNKKDYAYGATYKLTVPAEYASIAEVRDGKIYGKAEGTIKVKASIENYKGVDVIRGEFTVRVCPASFVDVKSAELSVYNAKDSKLAKAKIEPTVHYKAAKIADAAVVYEVTDGADKIEIDDEGNIVGKAEGTATVKVKYASDETVFTEVTVTVKPNYIGTSFFASGVGDEIKQSYKPYEGEAEIGGRKEGIFEYTQGDGADWDSRMSYAEAGDSIVNNARKGYKYFGYDLYLGGSQIYIGLDHADCQWFGAGAYLRTDYMQVIDCETGAITNRLERNKWIRIVYNLDYYLNDSSYVAFAETGFFYAQSGTPGSHSYIDNVRWYLDDEYYDHDAVDNVKYTLNDDGTISATNNEWTFDDTVNVYNGEYVETESTYAPAEGEIGGVSGAWKYAPVTVTRPDKNDPSKNKTVFSSWENQLKLVSATAYKNGSTGDNGYNVNGMRNLTEGIAKKVGAPVNDSVESKYKFVTFDLYVENGDSFNLNLNHVNIGGKINLGTTMAEEGYVDGGTDLSTKSSYLRAWKKGSDKLAYYIEKGNWYTVCLAYFDNYDASAWSCNILFSGDGGNVYYINDVKFHKSMDGVAPAEYAGLKPVSGLSMLDNTKANGQTLSWVYEDEVAEKGEEFAGALKFKTNYAGTDAWSNSRLGFDGIAVNSSFFKDGMKYIVTDVYFDENIESLGALTWVTHGSLGLSGKQYTGSIKPGETTKMYLYENGARVKGNVEANKWYKLVIPVDYPAQQQWAVASVEIKAKDASVAAYAYFNNITYTKDIPYECKDVVIADKPASIAWKDMAGDNTAETKTYGLSYIATPGLEVTWRSSDEDVATVSGGTITFKRGQWGKAVTITASAVVSEDVTITDSFTVTLTNNVTEFAPSSSVTLAYGNGDEADTIFASTSATNATWNNTFAFTAIVNGDKPIAAYRGSGNKFAVMDVKFDSNVKQFLITMWLNTGSSATYQKYVNIGSAVDNDTYFYDANGARVKGNIEADTWYKLYIPTDYTNYNGNWAQAYLGMNAKTEAKAEIQIKNLTYVKAIEGMHDLKITGVPSGDVQLETTQEVQLGVETDVEYTWSANNDAVATIDQTGKLTIVGSGKVTVTVTPTDAMYAGLTSSVTISVISEWDEPTAWHLDTTAAEWQGNTGDEFAKSWKVTGKNVTVAAAGKAAANADYIFLDLYLSKSGGFTYHSNMYTANRLGRAWVWGNSVPGRLLIKDRDWVTTVGTTDRYVRVYDMNGNAVSNVTNGVWYKVILPFNKEKKDIGWGDSQLMLEADAAGEKEVYFRNVSYGNELPTGLYDLKVTNVPTANVYLSVGSHQLGVDTNAGAVNWTSSADEIATVDSTGLVTFHATGSVNITVTPTDADRAPLAKTVTLNIAEESVQIIDERSEIAWRSLPDSKQITVAVAYSPNLTLNWSVDEGSAGYATVSQDGVVTFLEAGRYHDVTINVSAANAAGGTLGDSITFTLTDPVTEFGATGSATATYGYGDDVDTIITTATSTSIGWDTNVLAIKSLVKGNEYATPVYGSNGKHYFSFDVCFDSNTSQMEMCTYLNKNGSPNTKYQKTLTVGTAFDDTYYVYDAATKGRVLNTVGDGATWYTVIVPADHTNVNQSWAKAYLQFTSKSGTAATTVKIKNVALTTEMPAVHDLVITGAPSSSVQLSAGSIQLGAETDLEVVWTSGNEEVAEVDQTGKVTFKKSGTVDITVAPTDSTYASLAKSVSISIISEYDEPTGWKPKGASGNTMTWTADDATNPKAYRFSVTAGDGDWKSAMVVAEYGNDALTAPIGSAYVTIRMKFESNIKSVIFRNALRTPNNGVNYWIQFNVGAVPATDKAVKIYNEDGSVITEALGEGKWYNVVVPVTLSSAANNGAWGNLRFDFERSDTTVEGVGYVKDYAYGDTIPAGWINE